MSEKPPNTELLASPPAPRAATTGMPTATSALIALTHSARLPYFCHEPPGQDTSPSTWNTAPLFGKGSLIESWASPPASPRL